MGFFNKKVRSKNARKGKEKPAARRYANIAYTRRGTNDVIVNGDNGVIRKKVNTVWVTDRKGNKFEIPVDKDGYVPKDAIMARFLDIDSGSRTGHPRNVRIDLNKDAFVYSPEDGKGFTPQELMNIGWWQYPNSCDLEGIDNIDGLRIAGPIPGLPKSALNVGNRIAIMNMSDSEAARAREILARNFTGTELKKAVRNGGIVIMEGDPGKGALGCHWGLQPGIDTPVIILRKGFDEETLTHEFTHHLRQVDDTRGGLARTPFRIDENKYLVPGFFKTKESLSARNLEEAATVSESYVRSSKINGPNGYFEHIHNPRNASERSKHDREVYVGADESGVCRGRRAIGVLDKDFEESDISRLNFAGGKNALNYYKEREVAGTLPVAVSKPSKKKEKAEPELPSLPAGKAVAEAMRKPKKR